MLVPEHKKSALAILEVFWRRGPSSVRQVQDALGSDGPPINTVRATIQRLQHQGYVRRIQQDGHNVIYEATVDRGDLFETVIDTFAELMSADMAAVIVRLVETGRLDRADLKAAQARLGPAPSVRAAATADT